MKEFKEARENYESIPIPEELDQRVRAGIRQGRKNRRSRYVRRTLGTAAACFAVVFGALNLSPAVAAAARVLAVSPLSPRRILAVPGAYSSCAVPALFAASRRAAVSSSAAVGTIWTFPSW